MSTTSSIFGAFKSEKPKVNLLAVGKHIVSLVKVFMINSFMNMNGSMKDDQPWDEPTDQLGITFVNEKGEIISHRFNGEGFLHTDSVDPDEMIALGLVDLNGYACKDLGNGKYQRVTSEENSEACKNILNQFLWACGLEEGSTIQDLIDKKDDLSLEIEVIETEWDGKTRKEIKSFRQTTEEAVQAELDLA